MRLICSTVFLIWAANTAASELIATGTGADLRILDTVAGVSQKISLDSDEIVEFNEKLRIELYECRYLPENPSNNSYAYLAIWELPSEEKIFQAWMIAASPAISAMDHRRYDVWLTRCRTAEAEAPSG